MTEPAVATMPRRAEGGGERQSERTRSVRERRRTDGNARIGRKGGDR